MFSHIILKDSGCSTQESLRTLIAPTCTAYTTGVYSYSTSYFSAWLLITALVAAFLLSTIKSFLNYYSTGAKSSTSVGAVFTVTTAPLVKLWADSCGINGTLGLVGGGLGNLDNPAATAGRRVPTAPAEAPVTNLQGSCRSEPCEPWVLTQYYTCTPTNSTLNKLVLSKFANNKPHTVPRNVNNTTAVGVFRVTDPGNPKRITHWPKKPNPAVYLQAIDRTSCNAWTASHWHSTTPQLLKIFKDKNLQHRLGSAHYESGLRWLKSDLPTIVRFHNIKKKLLSQRSLKSRFQYALAPIDSLKCGFPCNRCARISLPASIVVKRAKQGINNARQALANTGDTTLLTMCSYCAPADSGCLTCQERVWLASNQSVRLQTAARGVEYGVIGRASKTRLTELESWSSGQHIQQNPGRYERGYPDNKSEWFLRTTRPGLQHLKLRYKRVHTSSSWARIEPTDLDTSKRKAIKHKRKWSRRFDNNTGSSVYWAGWDNRGIGARESLKRRGTKPPVTTTNSARGLAPESTKVNPALGKPYAAGQLRGLFTHVIKLDNPLPYKKRVLGLGTWQLDHFRIKKDRKATLTLEYLNNHYNRRFVNATLSGWLGSRHTANYLSHGLPVKHSTLYQFLLRRSSARLPLTATNPTIERDGFFPYLRPENMQYVFKCPCGACRKHVYIKRFKSALAEAITPQLINRVTELNMHTPLKLTTYRHLPVPTATAAGKFNITLRCEKNTNHPVHAPFNTVLSWSNAVYRPGRLASRTLQDSSINVPTGQNGRRHVSMYYAYAYLYSHYGQLQRWEARSTGVLNKFSSRYYAYEIPKFWAVGPLKPTRFNSCSFHKSVRWGKPHETKYRGQKTSHFWGGWKSPLAKLGLDSYKVRDSRAQPIVITPSNRAYMLWLIETLQASKELPHRPSRHTLQTRKPRYALRGLPRIDTLKALHRCRPYDTQGPCVPSWPYTSTSRGLQYGNMTSGLISTSRNPHSIDFFHPLKFKFYHSNITDSPVNGVSTNPKIISRRPGGHHALIMQPTHPTDFVVVKPHARKRPALIQTYLNNTRSQLPRLENYILTTRAWFFKAASGLVDKTTGAVWPIGLKTALTDANLMLLQYIRWLVNTTLNSTWLLNDVFSGALHNARVLCIPHITNFIVLAGKFNYPETDYSTAPDTVPQTTDGRVRVHRRRVRTLRLPAAIAAIVWLEFTKLVVSLFWKVNGLLWRFRRRDLSTFVSWCQLRGDYYTRMYLMYRVAPAMGLSIVGWQHILLCKGAWVSYRDIHNQLAPVKTFWWERRTPPRGSKYTMVATDQENKVRAVPWARLARRVAFYANKKLFKFTGYKEDGAYVVTYSELEPLRIWPRHHSPIGIIHRNRIHRNKFYSWGYDTYYLRLHANSKVASAHRLGYPKLKGPGR